MTSTCPICHGELASWVVRPEFTCHHCSWALSANVGAAGGRALAVGVVVELIVLFLLWLLYDNLVSALVVWVNIGFAVGALLGWITYRIVLVITPLRPQRSLTGHSMGTPTAPGEFRS